MFFSYTHKTLASLCMGVCMLGTSLGHASANSVSAAQADKKGEAQAQALLQDSRHITKLKNGLTVLVIEDERFPLVSTRLYVKAGSAYETPQDAGISHVLEHMVFKGTQKRPKGAISQEVEAAGGYLNAATSFDYTVYQTDLPAKHWALSLDIVKDMAFYPTLDAAELESEKQVILSELQRGNDNPAQRIFKELHTNALKGTPYDHPIIGYEDTIKAVTPASMRAYIAKYYQPQNMLLVVVGNVQAKDVLEESQKLFGQLKNTSLLHPVQAIDAQKLNSAQINIQEGQWNKVYLGMALPVPGSADVRSVPLDILTMVMGGDATSYLYKKYKYEKQLVDSISVSNYGFERVGLVYFTVQLDAENVEAFWKEFMADMASLKATAFTEKDIARAQLRLEDSTHRAKETLSGLASWKGYSELFLDGEQGERNMLAVIADVNQEQLQEALNTWFTPQRLSVAVLAPTGTKLPDLQAVLQKEWPAPKQENVGLAAKATGKKQVVDLGDGRQVVLIPDATMPYTAVDFYMTGGNSLSGKRQGLAALTASVLTAGTKSMTSPQIDTFLAERVSSMGAGSGRQVFWFSMKQPTRFNADMFGLMKDVLTEPAFSVEEVEREKNNQMAAIASRDDQPLGLAFSKMAPFLFGEEHPYGFKNLGDAATVKAYTQQDIVDFWKNQSQQPWVLSVAGDFDTEAVLAFARSLPKPSVATQEVAAPTWGTEKALTVAVPGREQAHHMLVFKTVPNSHEDAAALELLQLALAGQSGILFNELRDKQGLGYSVTAQKSFFPTTGYMLFYIGTEPDKVQQAHEGFKGVVHDLQKNLLPEALLQRAKNQMEGDFYRDAQSLKSRSGEAAVRAILGQDVDFRKHFIEKAKKVSPEDVRRVAQKYLDWDNAYVVDVTP